ITELLADVALLRFDPGLHEDVPVWPRGGRRAGRIYLELQRCGLRARHLQRRNLQRADVLRSQRHAEGEAGGGVAVEYAEAAVLRCTEYVEVLIENAQIRHVHVAARA